MVSKELTTKTSLSQKVCKLCLGARGNVRSEYLPSFPTIVKGSLEDLLVVSGCALQQGDLGMEKKGYYLSDCT
jgi:hypothetical protein